LFFFSFLDFRAIANSSIMIWKPYGDIRPERRRCKLPGGISQWSEHSRPRSTGNRCQRERASTKLTDFAQELRE
jgi:hypothetical protein